MANERTPMPNPAVNLNLEPLEAIALLRVADKLNAAGGMAAITRGVGVGTGRPGVRPTVTTGNGGGAASTIRELITSAVTEAPGVTGAGIVDYVTAKDPTVKKASIFSTLQRLRDSHALVTKGKRNAMKYSLPTTG